MPSDRRCASGRKLDSWAIALASAAHVTCDVTNLQMLPTMSQGLHAAMSGGTPLAASWTTGRLRWPARRWCGRQLNWPVLFFVLKKQDAFLQVARLWAQAGLLGDRAGQRGAGAGLAARHAKGRDGTVAGAHALAALCGGQHKRRSCRGENLHENQKLKTSSGFFGALSLLLTPWQPFAVVNADGVVTEWALGFALHSRKRAGCGHTLR